MTSPSLPPESPRTTGRRTPLWRVIVSTLLLVATGLMLGRSIYLATRQAPVELIRAIAPIDDPGERVARLRDVIGTFTTGPNPGDRQIVIQPDGTIRFSLIGSTDTAFNTRDTYTIGRQGREIWVSTAKSGAIHELDIDHFEYYGDTYERVTTKHQGGLK